MAAVYQDPVHYETDDGEWEEIDNRFTLSRDGAHCGLYYTASRYYDPEAGRFLSPDALDTLTASPSSLTDKNLYAYCDNNPVMRQDSSGEFWNLIARAVVGAVVNTAVTVVSSLVTGQDISLCDIGVAALTGAANMINGYGQLCNGIANSIYTFRTSLDNGASLRGAFFNGLTAGLVSGACLSNMAGWGATKAQELLLPQIVSMDCTAGLGANIIANVTKKAVISNDTAAKNKNSSSSNNIKKTKSSQATSAKTERTPRWHRYTYTAYTRDGRKTTGYGYYYF